MPNLQFATAQLEQEITPGSTWTFDFHVHEVGGTNFHWTSAAGGPYTPKGLLRTSSKSLALTGTVVSAAGGTAQFVVPVASTTQLDAAAWGELTVYADPTAGTANIVIGIVPVRTTAEVLP